MKYLWPVVLNEKRLHGHYTRWAKVIDDWGSNKVIEIKTEKGKITITLSELETLLSKLK